MSCLHRFDFKKSFLLRLSLEMVLRYCAFCGSRRGGPEDRTHHKFPLKDKKLLQSWLQHMSLGSNFVPTRYSVLCSDHFEEKCFQQDTNKKCLRIGSIPTLFENYKSVCVYCHAEKGQYKKRFCKFPLDNAELLKKWIAAMKLKDFIPNKKSLLCSDHFDEKCLRLSGRSFILKANAVPTLFSSTDSRETSIEIQENISNSDEVHNINGNQSITRQQGTKRMSSEFSTFPSKIQRSGRSSTSTSMHSEREAIMNCPSVEHCDENVAPSTSLAAEKVNSPIHNRTPILHVKHDHQYEASQMIMRKRAIQQQKERMQLLTKHTHVLRQHILRLKKEILQNNIDTEMLIKEENIDIDEMLIKKEDIDTEILIKKEDIDSEILIKKEDIDTEILIKKEDLLILGI